MRISITIVIIVVCAQPILIAQELPSEQIDPSVVAEELFAQQDLDLNYEELYETVLQYLASPLDLNKATGEELRSIYLLTDIQIQDLVEHRRKNGPFLSLYELQSIGSFHPDLIRRLALFVTVGPIAENGGFIHRVLNEPNNYFLIRYQRSIEPGEAFSADLDSLHRYLGTPDKYFARFRVSHPGDFSIGFTMEKDPGEAKVADYYSFHIQRLGGKRLVNFIAGDFQAFFGQGLVLGGGFGMGKGSETILTMRRNTLGFLPWTSSAETGFFRGAGTTLSLSKRLRIHGFASRKMKDAILRSDTIRGDQSVSLQTSGLHRNFIEIERQKIVGENNVGLVLEYRTQALQLGISSLHTAWDARLENGTTVYNHLEPKGAESTNVGTFINYTWKNFNLFTEAAQSVGWGAGVVGGVLISASRNVDFAFVGRRYARDFWSPYGSAISENSIAQNESAVYWGWKVQPSIRIGLAGYIDLFHFPWMQYRIYSPSSSGHDALMRLTWKPRKGVGLIAQVREERKARNDPPDAPVYLTNTVVKRNYCLGVDFSTGQLSLRTRLQGSTVRRSYRTAGLAIVQDVALKMRRWSLHLRHALYDTDDFDNRQYTYEPDMWMAYSFPAYYGTGVRTTAMVRLELWRQADLWVRWARTRHEGPGLSLGTGEGLIANDLKIQIRFRL